MRLQTKEQIQDWLKGYKKNDSFAILFWTKDEIEENLGRKIKETEWKRAVNAVDSDSEEQVLGENLEEHLSV
jgi:Ca2+-binding EF-hand superfamily protein